LHPPAKTDHTGYMRRTFFPFLLCLSLVVTAVPASAAAQSANHQITPHQAHQIAVLVARHEDIDLADTHIEMNSMDLGRDFSPGFYSFIVIRESNSPGPDETLRRYAVNRRTGDVWELTLCTHYNFPELSRLQRTFAGRGAADATALSAQGKRLGCSVQPAAPTS
jgi:hypothetical protein